MGCETMLNKQKTPTNYRWVQIWNAKGKITAKGICKKYPSAINFVFKGDALHFEVNDFDATRIDSDKLLPFFLKECIQFNWILEL